MSSKSGKKKKKTKAEVSDVTIVYSKLFLAWVGIQQLYSSPLPIREAIKVRHIVNILRPEMDIRNELVGVVLEEFGATKDDKGEWKLNESNEVIFPSKKKDADASKKLDEISKQEATFKLKPLDLSSITLNNISITGVSLNSMIEAGLLIEDD